jgi:hypothetical protein
VKFTPLVTDNVVDIKRPAQEARLIERKKRNADVQKGGPTCSGPMMALASQTPVRRLKTSPPD